MLNTA